MGGRGQEPGHSWAGALSTCRVRPEAAQEDLQPCPNLPEWLSVTSPQQPQESRGRRGTEDPQRDPQRNGCDSTGATEARPAQEGGPHSNCRPRAPPHRPYSPGQAPRY